MPLPAPRKGEEKKDFISRCMGDEVMREEYPETDQRRAVCERQWDDKDKTSARAPQRWGMKNRFFVAEAQTVRGLIDTRKQLISASKGMRAEDMRIAISDIYAAAWVRTTPETPEDMAKLYDVDELGVAHIPVYGVLTPQADPCAAFFAEAETEYGFIRAALAHAQDDIRVQTIALEIDSPGGYVDGVDETAQAIRNSAKPVTSMIHNLAASGAYWLASQSKRIVATSPADQIGSIGVVVEEYDTDQQLANAGIIHRVYTSTDAPDKYPDTKTEEGRAKIVSLLNDLHSVFVARIAQGRNKSDKKVNQDFGRGSLLIAAEALRVGMIDEIAGILTQPAVGGNNAARAAETQEEVQVMDLNQLKKEHPDVYGAAVADGVAQERERVTKLQNWSTQNPACKEIVAEAIVNGKSAEDVLPQLMAAIGKAPENPPAVATAQAPTASGEQGKEPTDADIKAVLARLPRA